ncbi:MAG: acyl-CoA dehydrogenase [Polyangia bacterium]
MPNDVTISGLIHKIGWRGLPSLALSFGDEDDCRGWLVGPANEGLRCMFQMMNEARLMVGLNATATASVGFHESLARAQGRGLGVTDARTPPVPLFQHADMRRMLLRQKAIVDGAFALLGWCAKQADLSAHAEALGSHGGAALGALREEILASCARADEHGVDRARTERVKSALEQVGAVSIALLGRGEDGDLGALLGHATDYLELFSLLVIAWMWTELTAHAPDDDFGRGLDAAARYRVTTELPRIPALAALCESAERSFLDVRAEWL